MRIHAFFKSYDSKHIICLFVDDRLDTKKRVLSCIARKNATQFRVRRLSSSRAYLDKSHVTEIPLDDLVDSLVEMEVELKPSNYKFGGYLVLLRMHPI